MTPLNTWSTFAGLGRHVRTLSMRDAVRYGIAVSPDERWLVASEYTNHRLAVYSLSSTELRFVRHIGERGVRGGEFQNPIKVAFTPAGTLLVADKKNNRVQELTIEGSYIREFPSPKPRCVALSSHTAPILAIGSSDGTELLYLVDFNTGRRILSVPRMVYRSWEAAPGQCEGMRFSRDGSQILVICNTGRRVLAFDTATGAFVRNYADGRSGVGIQLDLELTECGDIVVPDNLTGHLQIVAFWHNIQLRDWYVNRDAENTPLKCYLTGMATAGDRLYVCDDTRKLILVYE